MPEWGCPAAHTTIGRLGQLFFFGIVRRGNILVGGPFQADELHQTEAKVCSPDYADVVAILKILPTLSAGSVPHLWHRRRMKPRCRCARAQRTAWAPPSQTLGRPQQVLRPLAARLGVVLWCQDRRAAHSLCSLARKGTAAVGCRFRCVRPACHTASAPERCLKPCWLQRFVSWCSCWRSDVISYPAGPLKAGFRTDRALPYIARSQHRL